MHEVLIARERRKPYNEHMRVRFRSVSHYILLLKGFISFSVVVFL
jgi:hypothetical protein